MHLGKTPVIWASFQSDQCQFSLHQETIGLKLPYECRVKTLKCHIVRLLQYGSTANTCIIFVFGHFIIFLIFCHQRAVAMNQWTLDPLGLSTQYHEAMSYKIRYTCISLMLYLSFIILKNFINNLRSHDILH